MAGGSPDRKRSPDGETRGVQQSEPANRSPAREVGEIDNRGSHFCLTLHWVEALAVQGKSAALQALFKKLAETLTANEARINAELIAALGKPVDTGGYNLPDPAKASAEMQPSATLNATIDAL